MAEDAVTKIKEYIKTPRGKIMLILAAVLLVLIILAMTVLFVLILRQAPKITPSAPSPPSKPSKETKEAKETKPSETTTPETTTPSPTETGETTVFEAYSYRDPFQPLISPPSTGAAAGAAATTGTTTGTTTGAAQPTRISLQDIFSEGGVKYASINYGGVVYKVKEGDRVDDSPYQVLTIGTGSVILLYGDDRIELKLGQEIIK